MPLLLSFTRHGRLFRTPRYRPGCPCVPEPLLFFVCHLSVSDVFFFFSFPSVAEHALLFEAYRTTYSATILRGTKRCLFTVCSYCSHAIRATPAVIPQAAYDTVPREILIKRMRMCLPLAVSSMAEGFLVPSWISNIGNEEKRWFPVDGGVLQCSPLSRSPLNLFMEECAETVSAVSEKFKMFQLYFLQITYYLQQRTAGAAGYCIKMGNG